MIVLSLDPGEMSGYILYDIDYPGLEGIVEKGIFPIWERVEDLIRWSETILCEKPGFAQFKTISWSIKVSAVAEYVAMQQDKEIIWREAQFKERFSSKTLKKMGIDVPNRHTRAAWGHLLHWLHFDYYEESGDSWVGKLYAAHVL